MMSAKYRVPVLAIKWETVYYLGILASCSHLGSEGNTEGQEDVIVLVLTV
jgi:hypothetical protein